MSALDHPWLNRRGFRSLSVTAPGSIALSRRLSHNDLRA